MTTAGDAPDGPGRASRESAVLDAHTERTMKQLGAEIRRLRRERGYTLNALAGHTGLSTSMLSMLERGLAGASIGTLVAVSSALGVQMSELFNVSTDRSGPVHRHDDQLVVTTGPGTVRRMVTQDAEHGVEVSVLAMDPGSSTGVTPVRHTGHEFILVLEGTVSATLEDSTYQLDTGDGMSYDASLPHGFGNTGSSPARLAVVAVAHPAG